MAGVDQRFDLEDVAGLQFVRLAGVGPGDAIDELDLVVDAQAIHGHVRGAGGAMTVPVAIFIGLLAAALEWFASVMLDQT